MQHSRGHGPGAASGPGAPLAGSPPPRTRPGHGGSPSIATPDYWWYLARGELLRTALAGYAAGARLALDLGSADGPSVTWLGDVVEHTVSLDIDARGLGAGGVCGSAMQLPFDDATFDLVTAFDVIEHLAPEDGALAETARVLSPGGRLLLAVPAYQWAWTDFDDKNGHHRRYTRARLVGAVERAGFTVDRVTHGFAAVFPLFAAERLTRRVLRARQTHAPADIVEVPSVTRPVHHMLLGLCAVDKAVLSRRDLPFGSSVFLAATLRG